MTRDDSSLTAGTVQRRSPDDRPRHAPGSTVGRAGPRILIRLPDLREPPKRRGWAKWFGFFAALVGGSGLAAAGHSSSKGTKSPSDPSDLSDPANVARVWSVYQKFRPLVRYVVSHPKTIMSGALAAAAQFAALVAWHDSGTTDPATTVPAVTQADPTSAPYPSVVDPNQAPPWQDPSSHTASRPFDAGKTTPTHPQPTNSLPTAPPYGPSPPRGGKGAGEYPAIDQHHEYQPHRAEVEHHGGAVEQLSHRDGQHVDDRYGRQPTYLAARQMTGAETSSTQRSPGVAVLEGGIIFSPTRESQHEPQPSVH